jgi:hypothetical protein
MDNEDEVKLDSINNTTISILDYTAHLETLNEFKELYMNMYINNDNNCGRWIMK